MMMAKVLSVQLVSMLDFLFSDVDIVWFKNPLEFFAGPDSPVLGHDIIFQDDGSRTMVSCRRDFLSAGLLFGESSTNRYVV